MTTMRTNHYLVKIFGLSFAYVPRGGFIGNCFSPAVVLQHYGRGGDYTAFTLTIRTNQKETTVHWDGYFEFWWNSAHLARRFGKFHETDFGGFYQWGSHIDL